MAKAKAVGGGPPLIVPTDDYALSAGTAALTYDAGEFAVRQDSQETDLGSPLVAELKALDLPVSAWDTLPVSENAMRATIERNTNPKEAFRFTFVHGHRAFDRWRSKQDPARIHAANWTVTLRWLMRALHSCERHGLRYGGEIGRLLGIAQANLWFRSRIGSLTGSRRKPPRRIVELDDEIKVRLRRRPLASTDELWLSFDDSDHEPIYRKNDFADTTLIVAVQDVAGDFKEIEVSRSPTFENYVKRARREVKKKSHAI